MDLAWEEPETVNCHTCRRGSGCYSLAGDYLGRTHRSRGSAVGFL